MQYFKAEVRFSYFLFLYVCVLDINVVFIGSFFILFYFYVYGQQVLVVEIRAHVRPPAFSIPAPHSVCSNEQILMTLLWPAPDVI